MHYLMLFNSMIVAPRNRGRRYRYYRSNDGFTLVEVLVVMVVLGILLFISLPFFNSFANRVEASEVAERIADQLRLARNRTLASERDSSFGVYFDTSSSPHSYILFQGDDFASRDPAYDEVTVIPNSIEIYEINFGGGDEVVFNRLDGTTAIGGDIIVRSRQDTAKTHSVYIEESGKIDVLESAVAADTDRLKDSRHVHFSYSRTIDTATESIFLIFPTVTQEIIIADNIVGGEIVWEGEVDVSGDTQRIKLHTYGLNAPTGTVFSVHRDRRYNDQTLQVDISAEDGVTLTPHLIEYDASTGNITEGNSTHVSNFEIQ